MDLSGFEWVICVGVPWNEKSMQSTGNIVLDFKQKKKNILWINPIIKINKSYSGTKKSKRSFTSVFKRLLFKLRIYASVFRKKEKGFYIISPITLPVLKNRSFVTINRFLIRFQLWLAVKLLRVSKSLFYSSGYYEAMLYSETINYSYWIHEFPDIDSDNRNITDEQRRRILAIENSVIESCNLILTSSNKIYGKITERLKEKDAVGKVIRFPHGVDFNHFNQGIPLEKSRFRVNKDKPVIGYFGSLTNANDQDVYIELAKAGYNVVLIGDVLSDYSLCKQFPNIIFTGGVDYRDLPGYVKCFDIGIMCWKWSEHILNSNPKKTLENFSCGIPVVSIPIPQLVEEYGDLIYYAQTPAEFVSMSETAFSTNSSQKIDERISFARERDWSKKVEQLFAI